MDARPLSSLLADLPGARLVRGAAATPIEAVEHDSRHAGPGALFVAIPGFQSDGHAFIAQALASGASALLVQEDRLPAVGSLPGELPVVAVADTRAALSRAAAWRYGYPSRELLVVGVTGTDGKTTTAHLLTSVLEAGGLVTGRLGTVDVLLPGVTGHVPNRMSTPEATEVQRLLRAMADAGCDAAVVESTSHGLALHRLDDVDYDAAVFTNITGDHLDFHQTFEAYREAKALLFAALDRPSSKDTPRHAVVNADDPSASFMLGQTKAASLRFGLESREAEVVARNVHLRPDGSAFRLITPYGVAETGVPLPAIFNVMNALAAASVGVALGLPLGAIAHGLETAPGVPGRMERIAAGQPFDVIVDYAHTGDALRKVLEVLRQLTTGQLILVVGAAGERDPGRRFGVGRAAAEGADFAVFTSEDPRSEEPGAIVREIGRHAEAGGRVRGKDFAEIEDRREAIAAALGRARPGDVVAICGKGHEQSMIYGTEAIPWDDREVTREELAKLGWADG